MERLLLRTSGRVTFDAWRRERHGKHDNKAIRGEMNKTEKFYDDAQMPQNGDTAAADIIAYDMGEDRKRRITSETVFQIYWGYAKYSIFVSMATTIFGCIYAVLACNVMFAIKVPLIVGVYIYVWMRLSYVLVCSFRELTFPLFFLFSLYVCPTTVS